MDKRSFLKNMSILGAAASVPSLFAGCFNEQPGNEQPGEDADVLLKNWIWTGVDQESTDEALISRFEQLVSAGITGILIGGDDERMFTLAKQSGLSPHIWMWTLNRRDSFIMENHPEWYAVNRLGESCFDKPQYVDYYRWLCPSKPEVQDYIRSVVETHLSRNYIEGIHLDYVRYCDVILPRALWEKYDIVQNEELPPYDYCYCETCRNKFGELHGRDPLEIDNPPEDLDWVQFRYDSVTSLVNDLAETVHEANRPISAAVFPTPSIARKLVRQSWDDWNLDMVFPMLYHGFYNESLSWVGNSVLEGKQAVGDKMELFSGLYMPDLGTASDLEEAVKLALDNGAAGISLFGDVSPAHWKSFETVITNR
jgi:uncharacterized lipoprotein YddW (UPF0748 family)